MSKSLMINMSDPIIINYMFKKTYKPKERS